MPHDLKAVPVSSITGLSPEELDTVTYEPPESL